MFKLFIFLYTIICDLFLKELIFINKIDNYYTYKLRDSDINTYYEIVLINNRINNDNDNRNENSINEMKENLINRNLFMYCAINNIDITEHVRKFCNYYNKVEDIPWNEILKYLYLIKQIDDLKENSLFLTDSDFNEIILTI